MKKNLNLYILAAIATMFCSCISKSYYLPAMLGSDIAYQPRPMYVDSIKSKNYISALYAFTQPRNSVSRGLNLGSLNISRAHTFKNLNLSYGAFGFAGLTDFVNANESFFGGGLRTSLGYHVSSASGAVDFRLINWENALSFESGNYADFRKNLTPTTNTGDSQIIYSKEAKLYTTGASTEIIWHSPSNINRHFAVRFFYGFSPGLTKTIENTMSTYQKRGNAVDFSLFAKFNKLYGTISFGGNRGFSTRYTFGYAF